MYISKKNKETVRLKFDNKCAYSGTELEEDWQVDHVEPVRRNWWLKDGSAMCQHVHVTDNMFPAQKTINHYKHSYNVEELRHYLGMLHDKLAKLPKNPRTEKSKKHISYMQKLADYFGITSENPFCGEFYFEKINNQKL